MADSRHVIRSTVSWTLLVQDLLSLVCRLMVQLTAATCSDGRACNMQQHCLLVVHSVTLTHVCVSAGGVACLLCAVTSVGLQRVWALAGRFGAASALSLTQLYTAELLSSDVHNGALITTAQVCPPL